MRVCGNKTKNMGKDCRFGIKALRNIRESLFMIK